MEGEWEALTQELHRQLDPKPAAVYIPSQIIGGSKTDADMLRIIWNSLQEAGIVILRP